MTSYGVHIDDPTEKPDASGKKRGKNYTKQEAVTPELYEKHLKGAEGLGIVPVDKDGKCSFAVLDVDVYDTDHKKILKTIYGTDLPLIPFRSKSGGLHLYMFFSAQEKASKAIEIMTTLRILLMLDKKTEIFPKQSTLRPDESGNWINLPYFDEGNARSYALDVEGKALSVAELIELAKSKRLQVETADKIIESLPLSDAPPCLQALYLSKTTNNRNNYLMSLATYYKAKIGDDFEFAVSEANNALSDPIDLERLNKTVIQSQKKRNYSYLCKEEPICSICHKDRCKARKYGVGGSEVSEFSYGQFTQFMTDPPYYEWIVNDKPLKFYDESDMVNQANFRIMCFRHLHILPMKLTDAVWTKIMNTALSNVVVKAVDVENDVSSGSMFMDYLSEFLTKRAPAMTKEQLLVDRVYYDESLAAYCFKPKNFCVFLAVVKNFRVYSTTEVQARLKDLGAVPNRYYINRDHDNVRVWTIPKASLRMFIDDPVGEVEVNFMEEMSNEPY